MITGDFIRHNLKYGSKKWDKGNSRPNWTTQEKMDCLHRIWTTTHKLVQDRWGDIPIIPAFGNNDFLLDYAVPTDD